MAQPALDAEDVKELDNLRQKIFQLTNNIASLKNDVLRSNPLPPWTSLQTSAAILTSNIEALTLAMSKEAERLNRIVVYPSTTYPGRTQEAILTQLLRKKLEPSVESWVEEARATQSSVEESASNEKDEDELLKFALDWLGPRLFKYVDEDQGDYTLEERARGRENVNTGLRRKLPEDEIAEQEEGDNDDEEMEDVGVAVTSVRRSSVGGVEFGLGEVKKVDPNAKMRNIEDILRFATTGVSVEQSGTRR